MLRFTYGTLPLHGVEPTTGARIRTNPSRCRGWWGGPASTITIIQNPASDGGQPGVPYLGPDHLTLGGSILAPSATALEAVADLLRAAITPGESVLTVAGPSGSRWAKVRRESDVSIEPVSDIAAEWSTQVAMADPRRFGAEMTQSTLLPSSTGGLSFPCSFPLAFDAVSISGQVSLTNSGTAVGPVILRLESVDATPLVAPVVTHDGVGAATVWATSQTIAAGEFTLVNLDDRVWDQIAPHDVLAQGQASRAGWITQAGWSGFDPGLNVWSFAAASGAGRLTVTATEAW
jgi:hypothetical protein